MPHRVFFILLLVFALGACKDKAAKKVSNAPIEQYHLDGVVVSVDPKAHIAKIDGQKIEGWMEAMTMEYPILEESEFGKLHVGDHISATVFVQGLNYWATDFHQVR